MQLKDDLIQQIHGIVASATERAIRSVDTERVLMYWHIGRVIFEEEQQGKERAAYGEFLIKSISKEFQPQFGSGFTVRQLEMNRQFIAFFQIRTRCVRNSVGHITAHSYALITRIKEHFT